ncbi:uncharacterized protein [Amphiura filiformis]|uniref:uncharacterized protein n=1 Tax=Amphiura filiformis TaxID=82378 RepID=UPI003B22367D
MDETRRQTKQIKQGTDTKGTETSGKERGEEIEETRRQTKQIKEGTDTEGTETSGKERGEEIDETRRQTKEIKQGTDTEGTETSGKERGEEIEGGEKLRRNRKRKMKGMKASRKERGEEMDKTRRQTKQIKEGTDTKRTVTSGKERGEEIEECSKKLRKNRKRKMKGMKASRKERGEMRKQTKQMKVSPRTKNGDASERKRDQDNIDKDSDWYVAESDVSEDSTWSTVIPLQGLLTRNSGGENYDDDSGSDSESDREDGTSDEISDSESDWKYGSSDEITDSEISDAEISDSDISDVSLKRAQSYLQRPKPPTQPPVPGVSVMSTSNTKDERSYDKPAYCFVCSKPQKKLPVHIKQHSNDPVVAKFLALTQGPEKDSMWIKMRNYGNHIHNYHVLEKGEGELIVVYRPSHEVSPAHYTPCPDCLGYYSKTEFYKHRCKLTKLSEKDEEKRRQRVREGQLLLPPPRFLEEKDPLNNLLAGLYNDKIKSCIREDQLIMSLAQKLFKKHGHNNQQYNTIRSKLREIARLLIAYRDVTGQRTASLDDIISPQKYEDVLKAVRIVTDFNDDDKTYGKPSLALKLGHTLKKASMIVVSKALIGGPEFEFREKEARNFHTLLSENWDEEISHHAIRTLSSRRRNNPKLLPLTSDVCKLSQHLRTIGDSTLSELQRAVDEDDDEKIPSLWKELAEVILTQLILFNRKRQGEVSKITMNDYSKLKRGGSQVFDVQQLTKLEQRLVKFMWRLEINGKFDRTVPLLVTSKLKRSLDVLVENRSKANISSSNTFLFAIQWSPNPIRGCDALRKHSNLCGATQPELLRSTRLRKHVAVMSQVMNLENNELDVLANFLGHNINIHREYYRLPDAALQVAKVSKLLVAMERTNATSVLQGVSLEELEVTPDEDVNMDYISDNYISDSDSENAEQAQGNQQQTKTKGNQQQTKTKGNQQQTKTKGNQQQTKTKGNQQQTKTKGNQQQAKTKGNQQQTKTKGNQQQTKTKGNQQQTKTKGNQQQTQKRKKGRRSVKKIPWNEQQVAAVKRHLNKYIATGVLPGKDEILKCKEGEPTLKCRTWQNIKDYIRHQIVKSRKPKVQ